MILGVTRNELAVRTAWTGGEGSVGFCGPGGGLG